MDANKIDVDALFKQYTIKEIQAIELQVKNEIEKKKEDLRIMVYNRYRDIIDAADGIHVMKSCSRQIETVLNNLQTVCDDIFSGKENAQFIQQDKQRSQDKIKRNNKYVVAVIIKILQNSPSKIWYHLDNNEYIKAAKQYLLAQHAFISLELEKSLKTIENSSNYIQYANELWASTVFLSKTIATKSRETFADLSIDSTLVLAEALSAVYLLESITLKDLFHEFLTSRTPVISSVLEADRVDSKASIKDRILDCLKAFVSTVNLIYNLFSSDTENKTQDFEELINESSFTVESLKDDGFVISKIPSYLKNPNFKSTDNIKKFDQIYLSEQANIWLTDCLNSLKTSLFKTFKYATNLKSLVVIRDAVVELEANIQAEPPAQWAHNQQFSWSVVCEKLLIKRVEIWSHLVAPFYYGQAKLIFETSLQCTHEILVKELKEFISDKTFKEQKISPELDINSYIWSLDQSYFGLKTNSQFLIDFISNSANKLGTKVQLGQHTITPAVNKLCKTLDDDLGHLLNDIEFTSQMTNANLVNQLADIIHEDFKSFNEYLQSNLKAFCENLCKSIRGLIDELNENINDLNIKKILLMCRFTNALTSFCPSFKMCFNNQRQLSVKNSSSGDLLNSSLTKKKPVTDQKASDQNWTKLANDLRDICKHGFQIWISYLCSQLEQKHLSNLTKAALNDESKLAIDELIAWDEIEIEDESSETNESNKLDSSVKSKLNVPLVCSPTIQTVLYTISQELTQNLPYNMIESNLILKDLILAVFELALKSYKKVINIDTSIRLTQNQAMQILFDLKFLFVLFDLKVNIISKQALQDEYKLICSQLESYIDPFDYDICIPFIQSNITKSIARTATLYGVLNVNERLNRTSSSSSTSLTTANDKYNLLVLSSNQNRFELLPLPSQQSQQQMNLDKQQAYKVNQTSMLKTDDSKKHSTKSSESSSTGLFGFKWFQ